MNLKYLYHKQFLREKIDREYLLKYNDVKVLGENFVGKYYVVVFQSTENGKLHHYLLIENIANSNLIKMEQSDENKKYIVFKKMKFKRQLANYNLCMKLFKNGLYESYQSAINRNDNLFSQHRLVACLYQNIQGQKIHHIDKNKKNNDVCNLVKLREKRHDWVDKLLVDIGKQVSVRMQKRQKRKIFKSTRNTLAQKLILEILKTEITNEKKKGKNS